MERDQIAEAIRNVVDEGVGEDGVAMIVHGWMDPGRDRMQKLINSLELLSEQFPRTEPLERDFANALYGLTYHVSNDLCELLKSTKKLREEFLKTELPHVIIFAGSIFEEGEPRDGE